MAKLTLSDLANLQNEATATSTINTNNALIETALENTLSRDGTSPNTMSASLDMNSNKIINLAAPVSASDAARKADLDALEAAVDQAALDAAVTAAQLAETNAETAETNAETAETNAETAATNAAASAATASNVVGPKWQFETSTTMAAPATGKFRLNNATLASVTAAAFHASSADTSNPDLSDWLATWDDSTNTTIKSVLRLTEVGSPGNFAIFNVTAVTDNSTWLQLTLQYVTSAGSFAADDSVMAHNDRAGNAGVDGEMAGPGASVDGEIALYDGTSGTTLKRASTTGILKATSGVIAAAVSGTDYAPATSGSSVLKGNGSGGFSNASASDLGLGTSDSPQFTAVNIGHATDTTIERVSAGVISVEGSNVLLASNLGVTVQAYDADTLKADTADVLTAGFAATPYNAGTKSSGTFTPDEANGNFQYAVNGGAHTLAPPTNNCSLVIQYTNNGSAGTVTTSGFSKVTGTAMTTTNGDDFFAYITKHNGFSHLHLTALQ